MGAYKYIRESLQNRYKERDQVFKSRAALWREQPSVFRIERPTNLSRARELGYKAKQGIIVARVRIKKGLRKREKARGGRKPSKAGRFFAYDKSMQSIAEERAARKFLNCEVVNSYYAGEDGKFKFFETILVDRSNPAAVSSDFHGQVASRRGRSFRGLTSSGRKHRGI